MTYKRSVATNKSDGARMTFLPLPFAQNKRLWEVQTPRLARFVAVIAQQQYWDGVMTFKIF